MTPTGDLGRSEYAQVWIRSRSTRARIAATDPGRHGKQLDPDLVDVGRQQLPQRGDDLAGAGQLVLEDLAVAAGDTTTADQHYRAALTIRERLAAADPANAQYQRDPAYVRQKAHKERRIQTEATAYPPASPRSCARTRAASHAPSRPADPAAPRSVDAPHRRPCAATPRRPPRPRPPAAPGTTPPATRGSPGSARTARGAGAAPRPRALHARGRAPTEQDRHRTGTPTHPPATADRPRPSPSLP